MPTAKKNVINANIILYGPKNAGKSTNLQYIFRKVKQNQRGQIVPMTQEGYPHVSYEFLPMELGELNGYDTNLYIYTAPAHVDGSETRHNLLNEAAGVVFIVDSSLERLDDNIEALTMLKEELRFWDIDYDSFPIVFQYNHRDAPDALPIDDLETQLNPEGKPFYESEAATGDGVRDTFARICKMAVKKVRSKLVFEELESGKASTKAHSGLSVEPASLSQRSPSSEHTLNEAPPMRLGEYVESNQTGDELVVDDSDRPSDSFSKVDAVTDAGGRRLAPASADVAVGRQHPSGDDSRRTVVSAGPDKAALDSPDDDRSGGDDFLKTSMLFGADSAPEDMGMMEAGEAEVVEGAAEEDEPEEDDSPAPSARAAAAPEQLGTISLHESAPISAALTLSSLVGSDELNIQTVTEDEDEDDFQPVIRLGARARAAEEAEIEDEMMLDDEPLLEDESAPHAADSSDAMDEGDDEAAAPTEDEDAAAAEAAAVSTPALLSSSAEVEELSDDEAVFQQNTVEHPLTEGDVSPLTDTTAVQSTSDEEAFSSSDDESETESERSIIASDADLLSAGFSQAEARQILSSRMPEGLPSSLDMPITHVVEDEEEVFDSHRIIVDPEPDLVTPSEIQAVQVASPMTARQTEEAPESQALPDLAIAPLEDETIGSPEELGMVQEESASESASDVFELVSTQAETEESPFEMLHEGSIFESGHDDPGPSEKAAVTQALSDSLFAQATPQPVTQQQPTVTAGPDLSGLQIARWGEVTRVDERTLRLPITLSLPGIEQPVELAITLQVDQLLEKLLKR